jgi:hypothetical protein
MKISDIFREIMMPWNTIRRIKQTNDSIAHLHGRFTVIENRLKWVENYTASTSGEIEASRLDTLFLIGQMAAKNLPKGIAPIQQSELRVFSQWGEDGIIQYLVGRLAGRIDKSFIEFGVQHYLESNTLFLLMHNGWRGLVLDGEKDYIDGIQRRDLGWKYDFKARCAFVSRENINEIFREEGFDSELGILSIDVDGIDWYLWQALTVVKPAIVIIEYNRNFPIDRPVTIPYEPIFNRTEKHSSNKYYGTSLAALTVLAAEKGYSFVGVESNHRNAFFVRGDLAELLPTDNLNADHVHRDTKSMMAIIAGLPIYNVVTKAIEKI